MLKKLIVKNFALIDDLEIEFYHGLNVLTGETGSGKSILMESLNLLFGARADSCFIRDNTKSAVVSACFELDDNTSLYFNNKKEITIFREIDNKNGNIIKLDNESISLNKLREYSRYLGSFFSQDDSHIALDNDNLISYIDKMDYANQNAIINDYLLTRNDYYNLKKKYESLLEKKNITLSYEEKYKEQLKELTAFNVTIDEDISLKELILKISHLDKIKSSLLEVSSICDNEYFS
ncbi:MAG: AAA family ATPase, partial [Acholeplasmatales bacterium]|nr:AAA family ATPase [Acholeplasmatales bacterium]